MFEPPIVDLVLALGLGLLVGLQREQANSPLGGIRTFALISLFGAIAALLSQTLGSPIVVAGLVIVAAMAMTSLLPRTVAGDHPGHTSAIAAVFMYAVGAYLVLGQRGIAVAMGGVLAVLLHLKKPLHDMVGRLGEKDTRAIFQFALISLVILPVLPDGRFGPPHYDVFNPRTIWMLVVLIVGISLAGYVATKLLGRQTGAILGGIAGGLVSSTATTVSFARRSRDTSGSVWLPALVILIATLVSTLRVSALAALVARESIREMVPPMAVVAAAMAVLSAALWFRVRGEPADLPEQQNPAELKPALLFGLVYVLVLLGVSLAKQHFGDRGLYVVAAVSGLTDLDAITLSTAKLVNDGNVMSGVGWRVILVALIANLAFKSATVFGLGSRKLAWVIAALFGTAAAAAAGVLILWPK